MASPSCKLLWLKLSAITVISLFCPSYIQAATKEYTLYLNTCNAPFAEPLLFGLFFGVSFYCQINLPKVQLWCYILYFYNQGFLMDFLRPHSTFDSSILKAHSPISIHNWIICTKSTNYAFI